jgi:hypothetical protein
MRSSWVDGGGRYMSPFGTDGDRIKTGEISVMKGSELLDQLALAPENTKPVILPDSLRLVASESDA